MIKTIPTKPYVAPRVISAKVDPEFHRQIREYAAKADCLTSTVIKNALAAYLKANG